MDVITLETAWQRLRSIVTELGYTLRRVSFSTVVRDSGDYGCAIFDERGRLLAQTPDSTPGLCGPLGIMLRFMLDRIPSNELHPDDVIIGNDPWACAGHHNDVTVMKPIFRDGNIIGYVMSCAHQADIGGRRSTTESRDNYEEGLRIPIVKIYKKGKRNEDVIAFISQNIRSQNIVLGDIHAQISACSVGERRLLELCDDFGWANIVPLANEIIDRTEKATRRAIQQIPDGIYTASIDVDIVGGETIILKATIEVDNDELRIDWNGSSNQVTAAINCTLSYTSANTLFGVLCVLQLPMYINEGAFTPITVQAPLGTITNCEFPAPVFGRTAIGNMLPEVLYKALAIALPNAVIAASGASPMWGQYFFGKRSNGTEFNILNVISGGMGAGISHDGVSCLAFPYNVGNTPVEITETEIPAIVTERSLWEDSEGPGRFRGGFGQKYVLKVLDGRLGPKGDVLASFRGGRFVHAPGGIAGGFRSVNGQLLIRGSEHDAGKQIILKPGDIISCSVPGGGGYGIPKERDNSLIEEDIENGLISTERARRVYGYTK